MAFKFSAVASVAVAAAGAAFGVPGPDEIAIGEPTGAYIKPMNGVGAGPKTGWGLGKDGGVYIDATGLYKKVAPPFVRLHDIETPFGRDQFFDVHIYMADKTPGHAKYFEKSDAYIDSILAAAPLAKIVFRLGESIGVADKANPYAVKPSDYDAWTKAAVEIAEHYVKKYPKTEWYFEIWNEANLTGNGCHITFASAPNAGDTCPASDYFALYEKSALALGELRKNGGYRNMKIGGPAESGIDKGEWSTFSCEEFLAALERYNAEHKCVVPLDFYSWHQYDGAAVMKKESDRVGKLLKSTKDYAKAMNVCDEWNLTVDKKRGRQISAAEGAANTLATMIALQDSALDVAVYYDAQLCGAFNGLWYKPYLVLMVAGEDVQREFQSVFQTNGCAGITAVQRRILAPTVDKPIVPLGGYWAMRAFAVLAEYGETLGIERGSAVPESIYALAATDGSGGAAAIVNNSDKPAKLRLAAAPCPLPLTMTRVKGAPAANAEVRPSVSKLDGSSGSATLELGPYEIVLLSTGGGME